MTESFSMSEVPQLSDRKTPTATLRTLCCATPDALLHDNRLSTAVFQSSSRASFPKSMKKGVPQTRGRPLRFVAE